jgi:hypothetical protein
VGKQTEFELGFDLVVALTLVASSLLWVRAGIHRKADSVASRYFDPVLAAVMAYCCYMAAALLADAEFPKFLQDHLFDGLAVAFLIGFLINRLPRDSPRTAFPSIRRPVIVLFILFVAGALTFGLIAAAAVFSSGSNDYGRPLLYCAFYGGWLFASAYSGMVYVIDPAYRIMWWFEKRPQVPDPGVPREDPAAGPPSPS